MENRIKINGVWYVREEKQQRYQLGDRFSLDFDYDGMLEYGLQITNQTSVNNLEKLLDSFEDVNYHREASPLYDLIEHIKYGNEYGLNDVVEENIDESLYVFIDKIKDTINNSNVKETK